MGLGDVGNGLEIGRRRHGAVFCASHSGEIKRAREGGRDRDR